MYLEKYEPYNDVNEIDSIDVIETVIKSIKDPRLAWAVGSAVEHILRASQEETMQVELKKAVRYIGFALALIDVEKDVEFDDSDYEIQTTFNTDITNIGFELKEV